jgi:PHD/YefM family antitoxin component YafN of YafNO toxin-antitoxin module
MTMKLPIIMPIIEARNNLTSLPEQLQENSVSEARVVQVTRRGSPVLAIMPWELFDMIQDTLEIAGDEGLMAQLRESLRDIEEKRTEDWDSIKAELGL